MRSHLIIRIFFENVYWVAFVSMSRLGVATTLNARGWPSHYTSAHKKLRFRALKYYRGKGGVKGDGLPPPGCPEEPPDGESAEVMSR